jgi:hypothetical protein
MNKAMVMFRCVRPFVVSSNPLLPRPWLEADPARDLLIIRLEQGFYGTLCNNNNNNNKPWCRLLWIE